MDAVGIDVGQVVDLEHINRLIIAGITLHGARPPGK
jgi:hypothetical protein